MKMRKLLAVLMIAAIAVSLCACGGGAKMTMGTGSATGTYYGFGGVLGQYIKNYADIEVTVVSTDGSKANIQGIDAGDYQLGTVQSDVMAYAWEGMRSFEGGKIDSFRVVAGLYAEAVQLVTMDENIKSVADLKGKSVSIGAPGSGVYFNAIDILGAYGLTEDDIKPTYQSFGDSADALKNGQIDAAFIVAGAPTTAVTDLATTKDVNLVSLDAEHVAALLASSPYYTECTIPAATYGLDADVTTVGVGAVVLVRDDVSEDAVYALCADIFDNAASLTDTHAKYGEVTLEYAASMTSVPYHAGAVKYFAEKGITVAGK